MIDLKFVTDMLKTNGKVFTLSRSSSSYVPDTGIYSESISSYSFYGVETIKSSIVRLQQQGELYENNIGRSALGILLGANESVTPVIGDTLTNNFNENFIITRIDRIAPADTVFGYRLEVNLK